MTKTIYYLLLLTTITIIITTPQQVSYSYDFVVCGNDDIRYPEGTDCDDPEKNIEELIDFEKLQEELEEQDEKEHKEESKKWEEND